MSAHRRFPLDDDITDRILRYLPDLGTLQSTVLTCKSVVAVFRAHPNSIMRAVAYNVAGSALPHALTLARRQLSLDPGDNLTTIDATTVIKPGEISLLQANAKVVQELEDLFSLRHKDRTSRTSQLSHLESLRFQRALYNLWIYQTFFSPSNMLWEDDDIDEEMDAEHARMTFLSTYSSPDLLEINSICVFVTETTKWASTAQGMQPELPADYSLAAGPATIAQIFREASTDAVTSTLQESMIDDYHNHPLLSGYISGPLSRIFDERDIKILPDYKSILDKVNGEDDKCMHNTFSLSARLILKRLPGCRCQLITGPALWNETNWHLLKGILSPHDIAGLLKGNLPRNMSDLYPFRDHLSKSCFSTFTLLSEIHELKTPPYVDWDKQDPMCLSCISIIIGEHLHLWADQRRNEVGPLKENCWYGYSCRTQVHRLNHAARLNHFCEPMRGDDVCLWGN